MHAGALLLLCFVVRAVESKQTASFYGESYIRVQFQDASSSTDIELEFKSQLSYGLLFLAAGSTDYVVVELKSGLIEARLDLGSGEAVLHSQPGVRLDDLRWHTMKLARSNGNVELSIDGISTSKTQTRGQFFELNIEYGLFLGGIGNFAEAFYGTFRNYRGCLKEVYFNGYDILHAAKQLKDPLNIFEVFWQCDPVFDATSDQPVSFLADTSFLAFPAMHIRKSGTFSCDFKTRTEHGIILYNPGTAPSQDFIAVEIVDGKIKVSVDKGNGAAQMTSDTFISDGTWHQIDLFITPASLELSLDGVKKVQRFKLGDSKYINLGEHLFLGGLGYKVRASAVRKGLVTLAGSRAQTGSMKGCLRNIVVNSRVYGFREIQISRGISASCLLEFPCAANPCIAGAECTEVGRKDFRCTCDKDVCVKPTVSSAAIPDIPSEKILLILPVRGMEGAETPVTTNNIEIVFDYNEHRIRETAIIFHILLPPRHGTLEVNLNRRKTAKFSLKDLLEHKVTYLHDGTDTEADDATLEMEIVGNYPSLPHQLRERYAFVLPFTVKPRNDPPKLKLPRDDTLKIARNSRVAIHSKLLNVDDPDTKPNKLVYTVTYQDKDNGFFARSNRQDQSINTFTQAEINSGKIWYIHQGDVTSYIRLKVSDGTTDTDFSDLTVSASPLRLQVKKNTGIVLAHGTSQFIMNENLTVGANVLAQDLEVKYAIQQEPEYGEVQILQPSDNTWVKTDSFTQEQIDASQVRYVHEDIADLPPSDEFLFVASSVEARTREHRFRITLVRLQVEVDMASKLVLEHVSEKQLSHSDLKILTNAPTLKTQDISITVSKSPSAGKLFRKMDPSPHSPVEEIKNGDRFTQEEILTGMIKYKLNRMAYDALEDYVELVVSARGAQEAKFRLKIQYIPEEGDVRFVNSGLKGLPEGGQGVIESEHLHAETVEFKDFQYIVIKPVQHGELQILNSRSGTVKKTNVTQFTNQDIQRGELIYKHDDSENDRDSFTFITSPILNVSPRSVQEEQEIIELTGTFQIQINMRNDNPPQRAVDKVFQVVTNKKKIITINDLAFFDPDIDYDASKLLYKRQKIRNGEIVYAKNESIIHQFTQQDIIDGNILFHHSGKAHASSPIWVTDGQYYTTGLFEIVAMDPFVLITNNTGLVLQQGQQVVLSIFNLSVETNINVKEKDILFAITKKPANGQLLVLSRPVNAFSVDDLRKGRVAYKHGGNRNPKDNFEFTIALGDRELKQNFSISIFLESQQHPPKVIHNKMLEVEEGKSGTVEEFMLHVAHPDTAANDIVYTVVTPTKQGRLKVIGSGIPSVPLTFTQEDINSRKVRYFQTKGSETSDKFLFDVTNGFQSLQRLEFFVDIIPKNIPVEVQNLTVTEGGKVAITPKIIHVKGKHFRDAKVLYHVSKQPENGFLQFSSDPRSSLVQFSSDQIKKSEVLYVHDGNETSQDEFTIVAKTTGSPGSPTFKRSLPTTLYIAVDPVNDQPPRVTVNRGLQIWKGSMKLITSDVLSATDPDSDPEDIVFRVTTHPPNGHIAHVNNTFKPVSVFTQDLVDNNQIAFVHSGGEEGKFYLVASDGLNRDIRRSFSVVAVPLLLSMETNNRLEVYPKTLQPITKTNLFADTNDPNQTKPILYNFDTKPRYGRIVTVINGRPLAVTSFSQGEINEGKIHYQHTGYLRGWSQKDSMILEVSTLYAEPIRRERFDIDISYTNINSENQDQLIHVRQLAVKEGKEGFITRDHLDVTRFTRQLESVGKRVSIEFIIKALPEHGTMHINGRRVGENAKFTQSDIIKRSLSYRHDDSDTEMDAFELSLAITSSNEAGGDKDTSYVDSFFNITVLPVNDQPFRLVTVNPSVQVVQGFSVNITRDQLLTVDKDTKPSELVYTVINPPNNGILAFNSNPKAEIREFTQEDIDRKKVVFVSDGGKNPGAFYFKVWDGAARPYFKNFNIRIIPLKVEISKNLPVKIVQSESSVYLSQQNLDVKTNGRRDDVVYTVTRQPVFGKLYQADVEAETFKQTDIDNRHILYIQTDMTSGSDQFNFNVAIGDSLLVNQKVNISVTPLVTQNPLDAPSGSEVTITVFALDATRLATISGDNPKYNIILRPRFGQLAMKTRGRRDSERKGPYREVSEFTHEDILYGKVFYIANPARVRADVNDSFTYLVSAYNVQPAQGVFQIKLKPPVKGVDKYPAVIPLDPDRYPGNFGNGSKSDSDPGIVSPSISTDHLLIIVFVCLIILLITIGLIVFFVWKRRKAKKKEAHMKQRPKPRPFISEPLPLNQPNVHIEPSRPHSSPASDDEHTVVSDSGMIPSISVTGDGDTMRGSQSLVQSPPRSPDLSRTEVSPTVPACKVTPLVDNEDLASGPKTPEGSAISNNSDFNFDWALMDPELLQHCRTTNPVLRKNQYWV